MTLLNYEELYTVTEKNYLIPNNIESRGSGNDYYEENIVSYSAIVYSIIYYSTSTNSDNLATIRLTSASGGVKDLNSGFYVKNQDIILGTFGSYEGDQWYQQSITKTTTNNTWSYTRTSWNYVSTQGSHNVGVSIFVTIKHDGAEYTANVQNKY